MFEYGKGAEEGMDLPLSSEELRRRKSQGPTAEVPEELKALLNGPPPRKELRPVERSALAKGSAHDRPLTLSGYRPAWVGASSMPKRARRSDPPRVTHRGERLNPMTIWGADDRRIYNDRSYPWGCVCHITNAAGRFGSGVLIGPRHVLTASHVVDWSTTQPEKIEVHLTGNVAAATAFDTLAYAYTKIQDTTYSTLDEDYAVLVLDQRLGDLFGWLGTKLYDSSWDGDNSWATMGYAGDIEGGTQPTFQLNKNLDEDEWDLGSGREMTTSADMMRGQSGSPMFGTWSDGPYVVAVMSSEGQVVLSGLENWCSGGSDLNRLVKQARDENP